MPLAVDVCIAREQQDVVLPLSLLKNLFGLRIGWQAKITTDDIDDISSVEENIGHRL
jgi:hypothetical protein